MATQLKDNSLEGKVSKEEWQARLDDEAAEPAAAAGHQHACEAHFPRPSLSLRKIGRMIDRASDPGEPP